MKIRKSMSKPRATLTPKLGKKPKKASNGNVLRMKNDVGLVYPTEQLEDPDLDAEKVEKAAETLLQADQKECKDKISLLGGDEGEPIHLNMAFFKIPDIPSRIFRIDLPHTLLQDTTDVALIVKDLEAKSRHPDNDAVVQLFTSRLRAHGVKHPIQVITLRQIMTEFKTYEARRKLCNSYDVFLAEAPLCGTLVPLLGKHFTHSKKNPFPVHIEPSTGMKDSVLKALNKTMVQLSSRGNCRSIKVGHTHMSAQQIAENVQAVVKAMCREYPGGWKNVQNMNIKSLRSPSIPFYIALRNPNEVKITGLKRKVKHGDPVSGELTTTDMEDFQVRVTAGGEVEMVDDQGKLLSKKRRIEVLHEFGMRRKRKYRFEDAKLLASEEADDEDDKIKREVPENLRGDDEDIISSGEDDDVTPKPKVKKEKPSKKKKAKVEIDSEDEEAEAAARSYENAYLNDLEQENEEKAKKIKKAASKAKKEAPVIPKPEKKVVKKKKAVKTTEKSAEAPKVASKRGKSVKNEASNLEKKTIAKPGKKSPVKATKKKPAGALAKLSPEKPTKKKPTVTVAKKAPVTKGKKEKPVAVVSEKAKKNKK